MWVVRGDTSQPPVTVTQLAEADLILARFDTAQSLKGDSRLRGDSRHSPP